MMSQWTWSAPIAVLLGLILLVVMYAPLLVLQSRRFGQLTLRRSIADAMFAIYLAALVTYTLLPLPERSWCADNEGTGMLLRPFHSIEDILEAGPLRTTAVLQVVFNVVLFVPLGAFARRHLGMSLGGATFTGLATSLLIESTQATGLWWFYECSYRWADVDDVLTNTSGAFIGALLAPVFLGWLTPPRQETSKRREPRPVTRSRRLLGMVIDIGLYTLVSGVLVITFRAVAAYGLGFEFTQLDESWAQWSILPATWAILFVPSLLDRSASPGQRAVWLRPTVETPVLAGRLRRALTGISGWVFLNVLSASPPLADTAAGSVLDNLAIAFALACVVRLWFDRSARGLSLRASGMGLVDSREQMTNGPVPKHTGR